MTSTADELVSGIGVQYFPAITMVQCTGCYTTFSATGLSQHLAKTRNQRCMAVLAASHSNVRSLTPTPSDNPMETEVEVDDRQPEFEGDFFGAYEEDEIQWPDDMGQYASSSESSDGSDSEDDIPGLNDAEWEPLMTGRDLADQLGAAEEEQHRDK